MARDITIKVYQYSELSEAAKTRAREWWRSGQDSHESWSEHVTEDLKTIAAFMGWTITGTAFSGFSSQGDGAQFHGSWRAGDVRDPAALEQHAPAGAGERNATLARIMAEHVELAGELMPDTSASVRGTGRYSHSMATRFETADLRDDLLGSLAQSARALMDWYYRQLESSYAYENSDDVVAENCIANEYEFKANGDHFAG
jgi:hypothetical protein